MSSRRFVSWVLAVFLVLGQGAAFAHALTHTQKADGPASDKVCEVCLAQAQLGGAVASAVLSVAVVAPGQDTHPLATQRLPRPIPVFARARAPPAPSTC